MKTRIVLQQQGCFLHHPCCWAQYIFIPLVPFDLLFERLEAYHPLSTRQRVLIPPVSCHHQLILETNAYRSERCLLAAWQCCYSHWIVNSIWEFDGRQLLSIPHLVLSSPHMSQIHYVQSCQGNSNHFINPIIFFLLKYMKFYQFSVNVQCFFWVLKISGHFVIWDNLWCRICDFPI